MRTFARLAVALLLLALAVPATTQTLTGAITGVVKDEQGGVLPGATVTLIGKAGSRPTTTDAQGIFRFPAVSPGTYEVVAELSGFKPKKFENIGISISKTLELDFTLAVGGVTETIEVVGESPVVDTASAATNNALSQDILYNMPLDRRSFNIYNVAPGINSASAFGGTQSYGNALMLDGVDTRDPEGGSDWTFFNYNIMEEVQIQGLGAPAEYGAYTGAIVNTVSKSGGNNYAGLFDLYYTSESLGSDNVKSDSEVARLNPSLDDPPKTKNYVDFTGQISGPIERDKLFFFASAQYFNKKQDPSGPTTQRKELSHRFNGKLTWTPTVNDSFLAAIQFDDYNIWGRAGYPGGLLSQDKQTVEEDAPEWVWNVQWRHLFGSNTFLEAKYLGWWGYYYLDPTRDPTYFPGENLSDPTIFNSHYDGAVGQYTGGAGYYYYADRGRNQVNASLSHYAEAFGKHDLKFGVEIERSKVRSRYGYGAYGQNGCCYYYDYAGPYYAYQYSYDVEGRNHRESAYAQDAWKVSDRLTISPGVRFDWSKGRSPALDKTVYDTKSIAPRVGFAWDVMGDHKTVIKAHYGQFYEGAFFVWYNRATPGIEDFIQLDPFSKEELSRSPSPLYKIDDKIKHPRVDEITAGFERALTNDFRIQVTGIYRKYKNFISSVIPSARWTPSTVANGLTSGSLGVYQWANRSASEEDLFITNPDGFEYRDLSGNSLGAAKTYRDYKGLMVVLTKRFTNRWQAQVSYVLSETKGTADSAGSATIGQGRQFETPSLALVNSDGINILSPTHEIKAYVTYQVPVIDLGVNVAFRSVSGNTYTPEQRYSRSAVNFPFSAGRTIFLEPRGSRRLETTNILDLRLEKLFKIGSARKDRIGVYADIQNALNSGTVTSVVRRYPSLTIGTADVPFEGPSAILAPRQVTLGARWSF